MSADGRLAVVNPQGPDGAAAATWAYFVFPRPVPMGRTVALTEDRRLVAQSLTDAAMRRPWRWDLGDGRTADGWTVRHVYAQPGPRRITVAAYDPGTRHWYTFDQVVIVVGR